jgi:hypothetical protein
MPPAGADEGHMATASTVVTEAGAGPRPLPADPVCARHYRSILEPEACRFA